MKQEIKRAYAARLWRKLDSIGKTEWAEAAGFYLEFIVDWSLMGAAQQEALLKLVEFNKDFKGGEPSV